MGPFPNYEHSITVNDPDGIFNRYMLYSKRPGTFEEMLGLAYRSCPICGAGLRGVWSAIYRCTCGTIIHSITLCRPDVRIVERFDIPITDFELREDDTI